MKGLGEFEPNVIVDDDVAVDVEDEPAEFEDELTNQDPGRFSPFDLGFPLPLPLSIV